MKIKSIIITSLLLIFPIQGFCQVEENGIELESNITFEQLTEELNKRISERRLPQVTSANGSYTIVSYPSKLVGYYSINCAEIYYDANELGALLLMGFHIGENPFVQVVGQPNGLYSVIRLRRLCSENYKPNLSIR